jgi:UDP-N-acetylmuramoyl-tripeptide--D-alanyl-D-alanine ligase
MGQRELQLQNILEWSEAKSSSLVTGSVSSVQVDSRTVEEGALFVALPGERVDGHFFLEEVALKKAKAAIVSESYSGPSFGLQLLRVPDTLIALQKTAQKWHQRWA